MAKVYFHIDLDAFFASVEELQHPEYKNKPVIIGGLPGDRRSVVSTASYKAREYRVHSAMPISKAVELCPHGIYIRGHYDLYSEYSEKVMEIFHQYSPSVIQMSIDEAFIDMTGTEKLFGSPVDAALKIKKQVLETTGLTVSIGISSSMYVAKICSGYRKPDGLTIVKDGDEEKFMLSLPVSKLWGAGTKTQEHLKNSGFYTMKDIHSKSEKLLQTIFGDSTGSFLYNAVRGNRDMIMGTPAKTHSISRERTFEFDLTDIYAIETYLLELCSMVMWRLHREKMKGSTVFLKIRYEDFSTISGRETLDRNVSSVDDLFERIKRIFAAKYTYGRGIRLLGLGLDNCVSIDEPEQKTLFDFGEEKKKKVEQAIFNMADKNPALKVKKARLLTQE